MSKEASDACRSWIRDVEYQDGRPMRRKAPLKPRAIRFREAVACAREVGNLRGARNKSRFKFKHLMERCAHTLAEVAKDHGTEVIAYCVRKGYAHGLFQGK